jgi:hypothetical protein
MLALIRRHERFRPMVTTHENPMGEATSAAYSTLVKRIVFRCWRPSVSPPDRAAITHVLSGEMAVLTRPASVSGFAGG